jgi:hypothetical protein
MFQVDDWRGSCPLQPYANTATGGQLMPLIQPIPMLVAAMAVLATISLTVHAAQSTVQLGARPFYLVDQMEDGALKDKLGACVALIEHYQPHDFSIGHRGAALQFPEHTSWSPTKRAVAWGQASSNVT